MCGRWMGYGVGVPVKMFLLWADPPGRKYIHTEKVLPIGRARPVCSAHGHMVSRREQCPELQNRPPTVVTRQVPCRGNPCMLPRESCSAKVQHVSFAVELSLSLPDLVMAARDSSFFPGRDVAL